MSIAAFPTEFIAKAEKTTGIIPPTNNIAKTGALKILIPLGKYNLILGTYFQIQVI